jgi:hypothetical protein
MGGRRIPSVRRSLHSSARICAKVKVQRTSTVSSRLNSFKDLRGPEFLTVLPTPLPVGEQGAAEHQLYFPDSRFMAHIAILEACLSNFHDITRAQILFAELRGDQKASNFMDVRVFNRFLHTYFTLAEKPNTSPKEAEEHRMQAWDLYKSMVENKEAADPNPHTSALMLRGLLRYITLATARVFVQLTPQSRTPGLTDEQRQAMAATIIEDSAARNVQLSSIVADPIFATATDGVTNEATTDEATIDKTTTDEATIDEATAVIQLLTRSAFTCLSRAEAVNRVSEMGVLPVGESDAFLDGIEEVSPVTKRKVPPFSFVRPEIPLTHVTTDNRY